MEGENRSSQTMGGCRPRPGPRLYSAAHAPYDQGVSRSKKKFRDYSPPQQLLLAALIAVSLMVVAVAERDLQRRPADQVRGSKRLWRLLCLNALGSATYLRWGRRAAAEPTPAGDE